MEGDLDLLVDDDLHTLLVALDGLVLHELIFFSTACPAPPRTCPSSSSASSWILDLWGFSLVYFSGIVGTAGMVSCRSWLGGGMGKM